MIALFVSFFGLKQTIEFCDEFKANSYEISYGFRRITKENPYLLYVFINKIYWQLEYIDGEPKDRNVSKDSNESNWFGDQYSMAFCLFVSKASKDCMTYLLDVSQRLIIYFKSNH